VEDDETSEKESARALAPLLEVVLRDGTVRGATANDVLEVMMEASPRYVLRDEGGRYVAADRKSWTERQSEALIIPDREVARATAKYGSKASGVVTRAVRVRRRGTCGVVGVRLRPDIKATVDGERIELSVKADDVMALLAVMHGAKDEKGIQ
jgi:hypothetical protein